MKSLDNKYACNFTVMNQHTICNTIPTIKSDSSIEKLRSKNIFLSDVGGESKVIDVLIGADIQGKLMTGKKIELDNGLIAFETHFGWTVIGKVHDDSIKSDTVTMIATMFAQGASVSDLWHLDVLGIKDSIENSERALREKEAREFLIRTAKLNADGHYEVRLPLLENHTSVSNNYDISRNRLTKTISRLETQGILAAYDDIFKQWKAEGVIEKAPDVSVNGFCHYLPHRPVVKSYGSTKIRPVFDASAQKKEYPALNQCLEVGPNLIDLVSSSLNRFRESKIGLVADIKKAFLQISVNKCDRDLLRLLWVINKEIVVFRHCRIVFGLTCSPFILAAIIDLLLDTALNKVKGVKKVEWSEETVLKLKEAFYVDDCVTSVNSSDEMWTFIQEAKTVMATGGFDLRG